MTQPLVNVMAYLARHYPSPEDLSNARLTKLVYLADWESAKRTGAPLTATRWVFNHYGPWVPDVMDTARRTPEYFRVRDARNAYGTDKTVIEALPAADTLAQMLTLSQRQVLDAVIKKTRSMYFGQFIDYVYDTYPVQRTDRYAALNLRSLAARSPEAPLPLESRAEVASFGSGTILRRGDDPTAEQLASFRGSVHEAVKELLGQELSDPAGTDVAEEIENPTVESTKARYQDVTPTTVSPGAQFRLSVDIESEIEGFQRHGSPAKEFRGHSIDIRDDHWNDEYAWVSVTLPLHLRLSVQVLNDGTFQVRVTDIELAPAPPVRS